MNKVTIDREPLEQVEVVGWLGGNGLHSEESMASGAPFPLMTVAQHERITAALAAEAAAWRSIAVMLEQANAGVAQLNSKLRVEVQRQRTQSAPERVSVPVELLERLETWVVEDCQALEELRALLASHAEGGKV